MVSRIELLTYSVGGCHRVGLPGCDAMLCFGLRVSFFATAEQGQRDSDISS